MHVPGSFNRVFNLEECYLQSPQTAAMVTEVRDWVRSSGIPVYDTKGHHGFWRFLVLREGKRTGQRLVHLITTDQGDGENVAALAAHLRERFGEITTLVHSVNARKAQVAQGGRSRTLWGPGYIEEELQGRRFRISDRVVFPDQYGGGRGPVWGGHPAGGIHRPGDGVGPVLRRGQYRFITGRPGGPGGGF